MLGNKYQLLAKLSQGSFGQVYKGENIRTGEPVAIKTEPKNSGTKSLKAEAKIYQYLAKLDGFPQLKWYGSTEKVTYLVINLLDYSISDLVKKQGRLQMKTILLLGKQMIQRLKTLHDNFLIHRDIKPENLVFESNGYLRITDLGIARVWNPENAKDTSGTPGYMAP